MENVGSSVWALWAIAPVGSIVGLLFALVFYRAMKKKDEGTETMRSIAGYVREGAFAYLKQQYKVVAIFFIVVAILFAIMAFGLQTQSRWLPFAFLTGGLFSGLCGFLGMKTATYASARTTQACRQSLNGGLQIAFRSGAVMGLVVVGFGLLNIVIWFCIMHLLVPFFPGVQNMTLAEITVTMLSFGMGASLQALFARVGGGIYTKAADVGADLVGKVEAGIPEDDPRNPAVIADNVGDNVGDVAGMGADLFESYCGSILATAALGVAAAIGLTGVGDTALQLRFLVAPMALAGLGIIFSVVGIFAVRTTEDASQEQLLKALNRGISISSALVAIFSFPLIYFLLPGYLGIWGAIIVGLGVGVIIPKGTELYTSDRYSPTRRLAESSGTGPGTVIIEGMATGMLSTWIPILAVIVGIALTFIIAGGVKHPPLGLYGVGIAAVAMLSTLGITLASDAYGPIADNAGGNAQMSGLEPVVRERTDALDALGNTTAAMGKGFAIGSAALTALALIAACVEEFRVSLERVAQSARVEVPAGKVLQINPLLRLYAVREAAEVSGQFITRNRAVLQLEPGELPSQLDLNVEEDRGIFENKLVRARDATLADFMRFYDVNLMNPKLIIGLLAGSMMVFIFCALTMRAVGRAAGGMVEEVRRQFREIPGLMEGKGKPDYAVCVNMATRAAQREMMVPALLAVIVPVLVGLIFGVAAVLGLLAAGLATGFAVAIMMACAGGAWDNAKKYIEKGNLGGKGSAAHKAAVVGDTVGDPFKDTSGPSLNILIKLMSMIVLVFAGLIVKFHPIIASWLRM